MSDETVKTIIEQMGGAGKLKMFVGAHTFLKDGENTVMFKFKGSKIANHVKITLNGMDLYDVEFLKIVNVSPKRSLQMTTEEFEKATYKNRTEFKGLYNDMLISTFENHTKLYLSL